LVGRDVLPRRDDGLMSVAQREASLAQRERTLAIYAEEVATRSAKAEERLSQDKVALQASRDEVELARVEVAQREKRVAARERAVNEWERDLRQREKRLHQRGGRLEDRHEAVADAEDAMAHADEAGQADEVERDEGEDTDEGDTRAVNGAQIDGWGEEAVAEEDERADAPAHGEEDWQEAADDDAGDWMAVRDDATSHVYFWNRRTMETSWLPPGAVAEEVDGSGSDDAAEDLPPEEETQAVDFAPAPSVDRRRQSAESLRRSGEGGVSRESPARRVVVVAPSEVASTSTAKGSTGAAAKKKLATTKREPKWAQQSAALRDALAATQSGGHAPDDANDGRVECPHCGRRFSQAAAERHVSQCQKLRTAPRLVGARKGQPT
jgi:hypothetical protein